MKSERVFLMELFLEETLSKELKLKIKKRFEDLDRQECQTIVPRGTDITRPIVAHSDPVIGAQSPSMQRLMANNPDLIPKPPVPVTPAAAQALAARQALLAGAGSDKPEAGRRAPRKI